MERIIGDNEAKRALELLQRYKEGKAALDQRILENEKWWKLQGWDVINGGKTDEKEAKPTSAWLFNSIINKHADFMDNFPAPNILPREESDKETAKILSDVVPCILDQCNYEDVYDELCYQKLKFGTGIYGVFWDARKNGIGEIDIRTCDILNLFWEPGIRKLQDSPNLFYQSYMDNDTLESMYPQLKGKLGSSPVSDIVRHVYDESTMPENKTVVTDWYYKKTVVSEGAGGIQTQKTLVHYAKICAGEILYATEDSELRDTGIYNHGLYPFVEDVLFPIEGSPAGYGYIDIMKDCQMYIDKLEQSILKNAVIGARPRYFSKDGGGINEKEFTDLSRDIVHYTGALDAIKPIEHYPLDGAYVNVMLNKIEELKETSGNRDFSQGATTSGVTAASAIAALQEAGSKLSRDMIKSSYRACRDVTYLVIENIRQFYETSRVFRITRPNGEESFVSFDNRGLLPEPMTEDFGLLIGGRTPYFDIKINAQKASPFTKIAQNELAKEMYNLGFFNPQLADQALICIGMMDFDGKEEIERKIQANGTMFQQLQLMQSQMQQMAGVIAEATGDTRLLTALGSQNPAEQVGMARGEVETTETDAFGNVVKERENSTAGKARARVAAAATPKV